MNLFLSGRPGRRSELFRLAAAAERLGHRVVNRWAHPDGLGLGLAELSAASLEELRGADLLLSLTESCDDAYAGGGRHVEFGVALALGKRLWLVGGREHPYHHATGVTWFTTTAAALGELAAQPPPA